MNYIRVVLGNRREGFCSCYEFQRGKWIFLPDFENGSLRLENLEEGVSLMFFFRKMTYKMVNGDIEFYEGG